MFDTKILILVCLVFSSGDPCSTSENMKRTIKLLVAFLSVPEISVVAAKARYLDTIARLRTPQSTSPPFFGHIYALQAALE